MKTVPGIASLLLQKAGAIALRASVGIRSLFSAAGSSVCLNGGVTRRHFRLPDASIGGEGLHPDAARLWDELRARSYEGCGG